MNAVSPSVVVSLMLGGAAAGVVVTRFGIRWVPRIPARVKGARRRMSPYRRVPGIPVDGKPLGAAEAHALLDLMVAADSAPAVEPLYPEAGEAV